MPSLSTNASSATTMLQVMDIDPNSPAPPERFHRASSSTTSTTTTEAAAAAALPPLSALPPAAIGSVVTQQQPQSPFSSDHDDDHELNRHLTLADLISLGVGGTIGSGIFVLTGKIARDYAGPATLISWTLAGLAATTSALSLCELASRIPSVGSTYTYCQVCPFYDWSSTTNNNNNNRNKSRGNHHRHHHPPGGGGVGSTRQIMAIMAAACLTLEYAGCGAAVARTWGDKVVWWLASMTTTATTGENDVSSSSWVQAWLLPLNGLVNLPALGISVACTVLLLMGVRESKLVTNLITAVKVILVLFMIGGGLCYFEPDYIRGITHSSTASSGSYTSSTSTSFLPYGMTGVMRGTTSAFFGYLGYDEVCVVAGEALRPTKDVPRAILATLAIVTTCYIGASIALTGMLPYTEISREAGFPAAFETLNAPVLSHICAVGELLTLPVVVLISLLAQPRLTYQMAMDGLLPKSLFARRNATDGNLTGGTLIWGFLMTVTSTLVPFHYLDDLISCGILVAFCLANTCLLVLRRQQVYDENHNNNNKKNRNQATITTQQQDTVSDQTTMPKNETMSAETTYDDSNDDDDEGDDPHGKVFQLYLLAFNIFCACSCLLLSTSFHQPQQQQHATHHSTITTTTSTRNPDDNDDSIDRNPFSYAAAANGTVDHEHPDRVQTIPWQHGLASLFTLATVGCYARGILPQFRQQHQHKQQQRTKTTRHYSSSSWKRIKSSFLKMTRHKRQLSPPPSPEKHGYETVLPKEDEGNHHYPEQDHDQDQDNSLNYPYHPTSPDHPPHDSNDSKKEEEEEENYFHTPGVPLLPCLGTIINWYLIAQLELRGLLLLVLYLGGTVLFYQCIGQEQQQHHRPPLPPYPPQIHPTSSALYPPTATATSLNHQQQYQHHQQLLYPLYPPQHPSSSSSQFLTAGLGPNPPPDSTMILYPPRPSQNGDGVMIYHHLHNPAAASTTRTTPYDDTILDQDDTEDDDGTHLHHHQSSRPALQRHSSLPVVPSSTPGGI